jgi:hypothetical protein
MNPDSAGRPHELDKTSKADNRKNWSSADGDIITSIQLLIIACLICAILVMNTPETVLLTAEQISQMPVWGP